MVGADPRLGIDDALSRLVLHQFGADPRKVIDSSDEVGQQQVAFVEIVRTLEVPEPIE